MLVVFVEGFSDRIHTQFDVAFHRKQNVVRLDVSVDNTLGMEMLQAIKCL